jgi:phage gp16-like protein
MNPHAAIHIAKKQLGLDDETYRAVLHRVTGVSSSKDMTPAQHSAVLAEFGRLGFDPTPPASREPKARIAKGAMDLQGPFVPKIRALWIAGWNLGVVRDRSDTALIAFVRRQTSIDHVSWVRDSKDGNKAIEAVKAWLAREAGVQWPGRGALPHSTKKAVVAAQLAILGLPAEPAGPIYDLDAYSAELGAQIRKARGEFR